MIFYSVVPMLSIFVGYSWDYHDTLAEKRYVVESRFLPGLSSVRYRGKLRSCAIRPVRILLPPTLPLSVTSSNSFNNKFISYTPVWFARIYVRGSIPKWFLVEAIMKVVRNTVEGVRIIITKMVCSVLVAAWH